MKTVQSVPESATSADDRAVLAFVDPGSLVVGANVRQTARLGKQFVQSIRERGVLEPIVAYRDGAGELVVVRGQRRTLAAVEAGRREVPVMVIAEPVDVDRVTDQVIENDHREGLTVAERADAYEQLVAFGVRATQIARRVATDRPAVDRALAVAHSEIARAATQRWDFLTLDQAAAIAEFDADGEAVKQLVVAAQRGGFDHQLQRLRDARAESVARAEAVAALNAAGITVVDRPTTNDQRVQRLRELKHGDAELTEDGHASCPGHAAYVEQEWVYPDDEDGDDAARPQAAPQRVWVPRYVCTDYLEHHHALRWARGDSATPRKTVAEMDEGERAAARALRRDVIQSNKDWDSAQTVRRQWLRTFLARRTAPGTAAGFIAGSLARADHAVTQALTSGNGLAHDLLGQSDQAPTPGRHSGALVELAGNAGAGRAQMIALGLVLAAYEEATHRDCWRDVSDATTRYLRYLEANGYELSTVELRAWDATPATADADLATQQSAAA